MERASKTPPHPMIWAVSPVIRQVTLVPSLLLGHGHSAGLPHRGRPQNTRPGPSHVHIPRDQAIEGVSAWRGLRRQGSVCMVLTLSQGRVSVVSTRNSCLLTRSSGHLDQAWSILETCDLHPRQRGMALSKVGASGWPGPSGQRPCDPEAVTSRGAGRDFSAAGGLSWVVLDLLILSFFPKGSESRSVMSDSLRPHGLYSAWDSPDQNTGVGSLSLPHGIFPTQRSNPGLLHCRRILYQLSHKGSPFFLKRNLKILNVQICQSFPL